MFPMNSTSESKNAETLELLDLLRGTDSSISSSTTTTTTPDQQYNLERVKPKAVMPLSLKLLRHMSFGAYCQECTGESDTISKEVRNDENESELNVRNYQSLADYDEINLKTQNLTSASPLVLAPMLFGGVSGRQEQAVLETIMSEYIRACHFYACGDRINSGILTTIRFSLPSMRVRGSFHDSDMLALTEILLKYANGPLSYIRRLDFSKVATSAATARNVGRTPGFSSHGAFALSKVLQQTKFINEVLLQGNRVGPYGATAIFIACSQNDTIKSLGMRGCRVGERGAMAFAEFICLSSKTGIKSIDLSCNQMGYRGCVAVEIAIEKRHAYKNANPLIIDLEGNLVFQEVMNSVTHGLGVLLSVIGSYFLWKRVRGLSTTHVVSCGVYSCSLLTLYTVSTLYHSFFGLRTTRWIFQVLDKSAIYILIAGSYTPFLQIVLWDQPLWSVYLLGFLWICCIMGISVEFLFPKWKYLGRFSLAMYLAMGWSCLVCMPEVAKILPESMTLMILGGVAYTAGVPWFLRSNNLDHAIWHLFVLTGSILHWIGVYSHVATIQLPQL